MGQQFCEMSLYENTEELFGDFEENDYLCIRYLTYWNKAERRRQEVSKPLPIKVLLICKWLIIKGVVIRLADISGIKLSNNETEETENQVFGNIPSLLVCLSGLSCGWSPEIPDIGWLFRLVCFGRSYIVAIGYPSYVSNLQVYKRT